MQGSDLDTSTARLLSLPAFYPPPPNRYVAIATITPTFIFNSLPTLSTHSIQKQLTTHSDLPPPPL